AAARLAHPVPRHSLARAPVYGRSGATAPRPQARPPAPDSVHIPVTLPRPAPLPRRPPNRLGPQAQDPCGPRTRTRTRARARPGKVALNRPGFAGGRNFRGIGVMNEAKRYSREIRERAVRLVLDPEGEYPSQWAAIEL